MVIFNSYVKLPEGITLNPPQLVGLVIFGGFTQLALKRAVGRPIQVGWEMEVYGIGGIS